MDTNMKRLRASHTVWTFGTFHPKTKKEQDFLGREVETSWVWNGVYDNFFHGDYTVPVIYAHLLSTLGIGGCSPLPSKERRCMPVAPPPGAPPPGAPAPAAPPQAGALLL